MVNLSALQDADHKINGGIRSFFAGAGVEDGSRTGCGTGATSTPPSRCCRSASKIDLLEYAKPNVEWLEHQVVSTTIPE